jgi:hypothetical protein
MFEATQNFSREKNGVIKNLKNKNISPELSLLSPEIVQDNVVKRVSTYSFEFLFIIDLLLIFSDQNSSSNDEENKQSTPNKFRKEPMQFEKATKSFDADLILQGELELLGQNDKTQAIQRKKTLK